MTADKDYVSWLSDVKTRFRAAQTKAMVRVNTAMLEFYWSIGRDLTEMHPEEHWGKGIVRQFALDMRKTIEGNWSRNMLDDNLRHDLYSRSAKAITNLALLPISCGKWWTGRSMNLNSKRKTNCGTRNWNDYD